MSKLYVNQRTVTVNTVQLLIAWLLYFCKLSLCFSNQDKLTHHTEPKIDTKADVEEGGVLKDVLKEDKTEQPGDKSISQPLSAAENRTSAAEAENRTAAAAENKTSAAAAENRTAAAAENKTSAAPAENKTSAPENK